VSAGLHAKSVLYSVPIVEDADWSPRAQICRKTSDLEYPSEFSLEKQAF
jgi:hypothetical protein